MTIQKTLELILSRLDKMDQRLTDIEDTADEIKTDVGSLEASVDAIDTGDWGDTLDYIAGEIEQYQQRVDLADIRSSLRDRRAS